MQSPRLQDLCNSVDWEHEMNKKEPLMKIYSVARDLGQYLILNLMEHSQYISSPSVDMKRVPEVSWGVMFDQHERALIRKESV